MGDFKNGREKGSPLLNLVFGEGGEENLDHLPDCDSPSDQGPLRDSPLQEHAFQEARHDRQYMKVSICAALYFVLALIWFPGTHQTITLPENYDQAHKPTRRRVITSAPAKPLKKIRVSKPAARRVPMPDWTPDEPEPEVSRPSLPEPELVTTDDWDTALPGDGVAETAARGSKVFRPGHLGVGAPTITYRASPMYPVEAVKVKLQGYVILEAVLRKDGTIDNIKVLQKMAGGKFGFEREAMKALEKWEFEPGTHNGQPADVRMTLKISFVIY